MSLKHILRDLNVSNARNALCAYNNSSSTPILQLEGDKSLSDTSTTSPNKPAQMNTASRKATSICKRVPQNNEQSLYSSATPNTDDKHKAQSAENKIFIAAMMFSWRKQREVIKKLTHELEDFRRKSTMYDHRLHVYENMYDTERERSHELGKKLKESQEELLEIRAKHGSKIGTIDNLKASISLLEEQLHIREEQYEGLELSFSDMQTALFRSMAKERELQKQLSDEQRRVQSYLARENELMVKIQEHKVCSESTEQNLSHQLSLKQASLARYQDDNDKLIVSMDALLIRKRQIEDIDSKIQNTINEVMNMKHEVLSLRWRLENSWDNRVKRFWCSTTELRRCIAEALFVLAFLAWPSMPVWKVSSINLFPLPMS